MRAMTTSLLGASLAVLAGGAAHAYQDQVIPIGPPSAPYPAPAYGPQPAAAPYADSLTVYGRPRPYRVPDHVRELSAGVAYRDLDLTTPQGRGELDGRIARTADELCDRLGEGDERGRNTTVLPTCQASARASARGQVRRAIRDARPFDYAPRYDQPPAYAPAYAAPIYPAPVYGPPMTYGPSVVWVAPPPCGCQPVYAPPPPPYWGR